MRFWSLRRQDQRPARKVESAQLGRAGACDQLIPGMRSFPVVRIARASPVPHDEHDAVRFAVRFKYQHLIMSVSTVGGSSWLPRWYDSCPPILPLWHSIPDHRRYIARTLRIRSSKPMRTNLGKRYRSQDSPSRGMFISRYICSLTSLRRWLASAAYLDGTRLLFFLLVTQELARSSAVLATQYLPLGHPDWTDCDQHLNAATTLLGMLSAAIPDTSSFNAIAEASTHFENELRLIRASPTCNIEHRKRGSVWAMKVVKSSGWTLAATTTRPPAVSQTFPFDIHDHMPCACRS